MSDGTPSDGANSADVQDLLDLADRLPLSRRQVLAMAGLAGVGSLASGSAGATHGGSGSAPTRKWNQNVDAQDHDLENVDELTANSVWAGSVDTENLSNYVIPPDGADLVNVIDEAPQPATVLLRPGAEYVVSEPLPYPGNGSAIIGAGGVHGPRNIADSHIYYEGPTTDETDDYDVTAVFKWDGSRPISGVVLKNLHVDAGGADHGFKGFYLTNRSRLSNVWIRNTASHAFDLQRVFYADMIRCVARQGVGGDGLRVRRICNDLYVDRFQVNSIGGRGIHGTGYMKLQVNRPVIEKTDKEGILHTNVVNGQWAIYEPYFEKVARSDSDLAALRIDPDPRFTDNSGALNLFGGYWHQNAGDPHVWTGDGVSGNLIGGEYASVPGDNKDIYPKHHIRNKSPRFSILWPTLINDTREELIKSAGPVRATNIRPGAGKITSRNSPQDLSGMTGLYDGEQLVDDGSNTSRRGTICIWDGVNNEWVPNDGSGTFQ